MNTPATTITQYIRDNKRRKVGVLVGSLDENKTVNIGWSRCCKKDKFDVNRGMEIAVGRAVLGSKAPVPHSAEEQYKRFAVRCRDYFKDSTHIALTPLQHQVK